MEGKYDADVMLESRAAETHREPGAASSVAFGNVELMIFLS